MLDLNTFCAAMSSLTCTLWVALSKLPDSALCEYQFHSIQHHLFKELIYQMRKLRFCRHLSHIILPIKWHANSLSSFRVWMIPPIYLSPCLEFTRSLKPYPSSEILTTRFQGTLLSQYGKSIKASKKAYYKLSSSLLTFVSNLPFLSTSVNYDVCRSNSYLFNSNL